MRNTYFKQALIFLVVFNFCDEVVIGQVKIPDLKYTLSFPTAETNSYLVELSCNFWSIDSIELKLPRWMPGYYQLMDYSKSIENIQALDSEKKNLSVIHPNDHTWVIKGVKNKAFKISYKVITFRKFVANSFVDSAHAYIVPENSFLYIPGKLNIPVTVSVVLNNKDFTVATGLDPVKGKTNTFEAKDFDILYDCPLLIGKLEALPSFYLNGIEHAFIGYNIGQFDRVLFMDNLKKIVSSSVGIINDIPYKKYTFIAIGPGRGGIEHLNNTTISFDGNGLNNEAGMNRMMNFIAHEYFHHFNVKRIRPMELGPFNYEMGNRTNQLWISEGLTVYYEYLVVKRAGLMDAKMLLSYLSNNINSVENNPGRFFQSLQQASYSTWSDGPFGTQGKEPGKSISYYEKGPLVGLLLDFEIRKSTDNTKSLDDVMRLLYDKYYKFEKRGFTEAEFQVSCEQIAGVSLSEFFEYVYTTKALDYEKHLAHAGLKVEKIKSKEGDNIFKHTISKIDQPSALQQAIYSSWAGE